MPVLTIFPYLLGQTWVFDDPRAGLKAEAFVLGMTEMISRSGAPRPGPPLHGLALAGPGGSFS
jgi:hypothetical protein